MFENLLSHHKHQLSEIIFEGDYYEPEGLKIYEEDDALIIEKDNNYGFRTIVEKNGSVRVICKDDNSERSYSAKVGRILNCLKKAIDFTIPDYCC